LLFPHFFQGAEDFGKMSNSSSSSQQPSEEDSSSVAAFTLSNVLASSSTLLKSETPVSALSGAAASITSSPCLKTALLWGSAVSLLLGAHRLRNGGTVLRVANDAALGWMFTVGLQWTLCRRDEHDKRIALRAFYQNRQQMAQSPNAAHEALLGISKFTESNTRKEFEEGTANAFPISASATTIEDEEVKRELERLTSYGTLSKVTISEGEGKLQ
jgi:hypothetical protein